jgi:DNA mismatch endonuclease (patch repair protein)
MVDHLSSTERSRNMSRVKGRDTKPERLVRSLIHRMGFRFSLHRKDLPGKPDIVLTRFGKVIFVHGCFWHGHPDCPRAARPSTNREFWNKKIKSNIVRDTRTLHQLREKGWEPHVVWQCETRDIARLTKRLSIFLATRA